MNKISTVVLLILLFSGIPAQAQGPVSGAGGDPSVKGKPIIDGTELIAVSKATATDWFASDIGLGDSLAGAGGSEKHICEFNVETATVVQILTKRSGESTVTSAFNGGAQLAANSKYRFSFCLAFGDTYNIRHVTGNPQDVSSKCFRGWCE